MDREPTASPRRVIMFKKALLTFSETFIAQQGLLLPRSEVVFAGLRRRESGQYLLPADRTLILGELGWPRWWQRLSLDLGWAPPTWIKALRRERPAIFHAQFGPSGVVALPLARALGIPLVVTFRGSDATNRGGNRRQVRGYQRLFREAAAILTVAEHLRGRLLDLGCPADKLQVLHNGVDLTKFAEPATPDARPTIVFAGRLVEKKGVGHLVEAVARVRSAVPDVHLVLIGRGEQMEGLRQRVKALDLSAEFLGLQPHAEVIRHLRRGWVMAGPSLLAGDGDAEGLPNVHIEAQALGLPVVAFDTPGVDEAVVAGKTGLLAPVGDVAALAEALRKTLTDEALRRSLGTSARERVWRDFDMRRQCAKLEGIYDGALALPVSGRAHTVKGLTTR